MIYMLKDGPMTIGYGRTVDEAVQQACAINRRLSLCTGPFDEKEMKAMIDNGSIKVREMRK